MSLAPPLNIICIVADDLGYADLGCYGGRAPVSPVLDRLASQGMRFTQGYSNSPVCSPTRYALMTGRYQYHWRGAADEPMSSAARGSTVLGLPPGVPTLPSLLRAAGYRTKLVGKWHLGYPPAFGPLRSGYDEFFGAHSGGIDYHSHVDTSGVSDLWNGEEPCHSIGYVTDLFSRAAAEYVRRMAAGARQGQPFFLSLHYTAPHWPWETRDDQACAVQGESLFHRSGGSIDIYRKMIHHMDEGIGWVLGALDDAGIADHTLVVFTSDNGGERFSDNWPLVGGKLDLTEGGIRVPWIARWPAGIPAGRVSAQHCMTMDWTVSMLLAAGALANRPEPLAGFDGVSLLPAWRGANPYSRPMYWRMKHRGQRAHRDGDWKYLRVDGHDYLFNLAVDERERANQMHKAPQRLQQMRSAWEAWEATVPPIPADAQVLPGYTAQDMPQR